VRWFDIMSCGLAPEESRAPTPETVAGSSGEIQTGHFASASQKTLQLELTSQMEWWVKSPGGHLVLYSAAIFVQWGTFLCFDSVLSSKNTAT
jgi:hypothetical protein